MKKNIIKPLGRLAVLVFAFALGIAVHAQSFITNGLVAYFPFDGNANDASGNDHNGTVTGAALTTDRFGQANHAYLFGGGAAYITVPFSSSVFSNDFTVSVWFKASDLTGGWPTLLLQASDFPTQFNPFNIAISGNTCGCDAPGYLVSMSSYAPATFSWLLVRRQQTPLGTYCQVVVIKEGTSVTMFLNSQVTVTGQVSNPITQPGGTLWIGRAATEDVPGAYVFHGVLDDIRIYDRAFSTSEVQQLYALERGPYVSIAKAVRLDFSSLSVGTNYQLQFSHDLSGWQSLGASFTATASTNSQYLDIGDWNRFWRLQVAP